MTANIRPVSEVARDLGVAADDLYPYGRDSVWVWKSFMRGLHPQALESYGVIPENPPRIDYERDEQVRKALGQCVTYADSMNLAAMHPSRSVSSTGYCLANPGSEYLAFSPDGAPFTLEIEGQPSDYTLTWLNVASNEAALKDELDSNTLTPPFEGPAVAHLVRSTVR